MSTAIDIRNLTKKFGSKRALDNISLAIPSGSIFGFLGPNGSGKTTMIRCLMDYIRPTNGKITIFGKDAHIDSASLKNHIGYLSSDMQLHADWTAKQHIDLVGKIRGRGPADKLIKSFHLDTKTPVNKLSSGNRQKLAIILAFMGDPKLIIMDEPTRGLDPLLQNQLYALLKKFKQSGGTVFLSSHNLSEVQQVCDSVAVIKDGQIVASELMKDILQMKVHMIQATSDSAIKKSDFDNKDIEIITITDKTIAFKARGKLDEVVKILAKYKLTDLEITHVSLEDVFLEYY